MSLCSKSLEWFPEWKGAFEQQKGALAFCPLVCWCPAHVCSCTLLANMRDSCRWQALLACRGKHSEMRAGDVEHFLPWGHEDGICYKLLQSRPLNINCETALCILHLSASLCLDFSTVLCLHNVTFLDLFLEYLSNC